MARENSLKDLMAFFSVPGKPVSAKEMADFWKAIPDEEKAYYKSADLS